MRTVSEFIHVFNKGDTKCLFCGSKNLILDHEEFFLQSLKVGFLGQCLKKPLYCVTCYDCSFTMLFSSIVIEKERMNKE